ncbi:GNAT family N-acetyltransferase [Kribbella solani]|uniref:GNAT superfamily N-acetyltransferase n=1 Tax=Kribbella solani TaxID=236067 RepID=A0A841DID0_9ACTN|nr:GNAT family N-acetyltransferase [Kribbella solani]MBB5978252.1 GNAT superfamily N-acetyltransferase [Kribbella solani]
MIHRATPAEYETVVNVLSDAFATDPLTRWLFPHTIELATTFYFHPLLAHPDAEADLTPGNTAASIWLHLTRGQSAYGEPSTQPVPTAAHRLQALGQALAPRHPRDQAYIYLPCMGVTSAHRGGGLGSAMLRHRIAWADSLGLGTYLEASSPRSRALYLRHGFHDHGEPIRVADSPAIWPMWRPTTTGDHR